MNQECTGYPSIDKPWVRYYKDKSEIVIPQCSFYERMRRVASNADKKTAIEYFGLRISYRKLLQRIEETAKALRALGVSKGDIVSVCLPNIPEAVYLLYAINRVGAVANMLDVRSSEVILLDALNVGKSTVLFCLDSVVEKNQSIFDSQTVKYVIAVSPIQSLPGIVRTALRVGNKSLRVKLEKEVIKWKMFIQKGREVENLEDIAFEPNADAVIAYTGGTTGKPKGVIGTNETINAVIEMELRVGFNERERDRILCVAPPWTYYGICNSLNVPLNMGLTLVLVPKMEADELGRMIVKYKPNHTIVVPTMLSSFINYSELRNQDLSFIHSLIVGADRLDETLEKETDVFLQAHNCECVVTKGYGMTEVMAAAAYTMEGAEDVGSVGIPYPGNTITAFTEKDREYEECKIGEIGELAISGPTMMKSYFGSAAQENADVMKVHADNSLWIHTGDMGYVGTDGRIYIEGRKKRMFVKNGYKIFPASIEQCIMKHEDVESAAVIAVNDTVYGNNIRAFVKPKSARAVKETELKELVANELYDYELPDEYVFVENIPLTDLGKIDYRVLESTN